MDMNMLGLQLELTFWFYFLQKKSRSWTARHDLRLKESVNSFSACSLEYLLRGEDLQERGKEACAHQQGVGGQITS